MLPTWAAAALSDQWTDGSWETGKAVAIAAKHGRLEDIPVLATQADEACRPCSPETLKQRLTLLGMTMSPNRPPAEAKAWLHEFARLLSDVPEDLLFSALDQLQLTLKFLPTVAEIRVICDKPLENRRRDRSRIDAMRRWLESGQPVPKPLPPPSPHIADRDRSNMTSDEYRELNEYLERVGSCFRYRDDGERYQVSERKTEPAGQQPRRNPTRADYIALGIDPSVLDAIDAEKRARSGEADTGTQPQATTG